MKALVLGCGLVGREIVRDLAQGEAFSVTAVDRDEAALARVTDRLEVRGLVRDLSQPGAAGQLARDHDVIVGAVPGWLGLQVVREAVEEGRPVADISFMPEDPYATLDELAQSKGVPVVVDCGVAPGTSNLLVGHAASELDEVHDVRIVVGGLPVVRRLPYEYAAVFSPPDIIEEYTRPATVIEDGRQVVRPALDELEHIEFPGLGTLEAFLTNGLRTLPRTIKARNMKEKTLRYPGHCEKIRLLVESGFFDEEPITVEGVSVRPVDVTARVLARLWQMPDGEEDLTVMTVEVTGRREGEEVLLTYQLVDVYDADNGVTSMARTTGYACTAAVKLLATKRIEATGVIPMEQIGARSALYHQVLKHLRERGIVIGEAMD